MIIILAIYALIFVEDIRLKGKAIKHPTKTQQLQQAALVFLVTAVQLTTDKLPVEDASLKRAWFVDGQMRVECGVEGVLYFYRHGRSNVNQ